MFLLNSLSKVDSTPLNVMIVSGIFWNFVYSTYLTTWPRVWFPPCASRFQCQRPFRFQPGRENLLLRLSWNWGARRGRRLQPREPRCRRTLRRSNKSRNTRKSKDLLISSSFFELTNSFSLTWYVSFMQNGVVGVMRIQISVPAFSWQWRRRRGEEDDSSVCSTDSDSTAIHYVLGDVTHPHTAQGDAIIVHCVGKKHLLPCHYHSDMSLSLIDW